jgi:hypothetical protein
MKTITIPIITRLQDNGDGGYTFYAYNNKEQLLADHPNSRVWDSNLKKYVKKQLTHQEKQDILNEDDPYENGYISPDSIEIEMDGEGNPRLDPKGISFYAGQ